VYRIIIHVGPWKTGSSALQEFFHINRELLLHHGVLFPLGLVTKSAHHEIPNLITDSMSRFHFLTNLEQISLRDLLKRYFDEMKLSKIFTLLLSSEDFASLNSEHYSKLFSSLPFGEDTKIEFIYFDFDPEARLSSYRGEYIRHGEFVDSKALKQILNYISSMKRKIEEALLESSDFVHKIDYQSLKHPTEIFEKFVDILFNGNSGLFQSQCSIPTKNLNVSIPTEKLDQLNEFNRLNIGDRHFDFNLPVIFSDAYPAETDRFIKYASLLEESIQRDSALAERDSALAERDSALAERDSALAERDSALAERDSVIDSKIWRIFQPYRLLRSSIQKDKEVPA